MNRLSHLVAILGLAAATASAQPPRPPPGGPFLDIERLTILLDLDAYQKGEVERLLNEQREQMRATRDALEDSGERPSFEEMHARREQARTELVTKLETVLTPQQITKFKVLTERPNGPRGGRGRGRAL